MLGAELRRVRGAVLSSRWGPPAALLAWGALAGLVFAVWLAPPGAQRRPPPVRTAADSRPSAEPPAKAPAAVPAHAEAAPRQDAAAADAARIAAAVARWRVAPGPAPHVYADARDERPGATLLSAGAPAAVQPAAAAVLIRHRDGSAAGRAVAERIAEEARRAGVAVVGIRAASSVPKGREVRYLQGADAAQAERLAERFRGRWGSAWEVRTPGPAAPPAPKASTAATRPAPAHTLEVWLPHR